MTAADLIELLTDAANELGVDLSDLEVLVADQPGWPLAKTVAAVTPELYVEGRESGDPDITDEELDSSVPMVWIATGDHPRDRSPYAPSTAWDGLVDAR